MLIYRYLRKEVMTVWVVIVSLLLLILLSNQLVLALHNVTEGKLPYGLVMRLLGLQIPQLLAFLLPLSLYLALLWAYGHLQAHHEWTVMMASGVSSLQLLWMTLRIVLGFAIFYAVLWGWLQPLASSYRYQLISHAIEYSPLKQAASRHFQPIKGKKWVLYVEKFSHDHHEMTGIFLTKRSRQVTPSEPLGWDVITANRGSMLWKPSHNYYVFSFPEGYRYQAIPSRDETRIMHYLGYHIRIAGPRVGLRKKIESSNIVWLWRHYAQQTDATSELYWRLSSMITLFVLSVLAWLWLKYLPATQHFLRLIMAILSYIAYVSWQLIGKAWVQSGQWPIWPTLGLVHGVVFALLLLLIGIRYRALIMMRLKSFLGVQ